MTVAIYIGVEQLFFQAREIKQGAAIMQINLRPTESSDHLFLFELYISTRIEEVSSRGWDVLQQQAFMRMQYQAQQWEHHGQYSQIEDYLVLEGVKPIGRLLISQESSTLHLADIALLASYRNLGIGTGLIRDLQMKAARLGTSIHLQVPKLSRAVALFDRLGFRVREEQGHFLKMEWLPLAKRVSISRRRNGRGIQRG